MKRKPLSRKEVKFITSGKPARHNSEKTEAMLQHIVGCSLSNCLEDPPIDHTKAFKDWIRTPKGRWLSRLKMKTPWGLVRHRVKLFKVGKGFQWIRFTEGQKGVRVSPRFGTREAARFVGELLRGHWFTNAEWKEYYPLPKDTPPLPEYKPTKKTLCQTKS